MRFSSAVMVASSACEPSKTRKGAGWMSTLSMKAAAMRAGSPGACAAFASSIFSKERVGPQAKRVLLQGMTPLLSGPNSPTLSHRQLHHGPDDFHAQPRRAEQRNDLS